MDKKELIAEVLTLAGILVLVAIAAVLGVALVIAFNEQFGEFEYTTKSGETGTASFCTVSYGELRCRNDDGTTINVERYTKK